MKRVYIKPSIEVIELVSENMLQSGSDIDPTKLELLNDDGPYEKVDEL